MFVLASLRRTCKPGRCKHKHKRKERKLRNSDKLSAYILVARALPFSALLESNLAPKRQPGRAIAPIFMLLRLRMSPYAYIYRTCKHPFAYACVVRINQALMKLDHAVMPRLNFTDFTLSPWKLIYL